MGKAVEKTLALAHQVDEHVGLSKEKSALKAHITKHMINDMILNFTIIFSLVKQVPETENIL